MKRRQFLSFSTALLAFSSPVAFASEIPAAWEDGSLIFRLSAWDRVTRAIRAHSPWPEEMRLWTHVGMIARDGRFVIHAYPGHGVTVQRVQDFIDPRVCQQYAVLQPELPGIGPRMAARLQTQVGKPFDDELSPDGIYCTNVIAKVLDVHMPASLYRTWALGYRHKMLHPDDLFYFLLATKEYGLAYDDESQKIQRLLLERIG